MLSWLFKKRGNVAAPIAPPTPAHADRQAAARRPAPAAAGAARPVEAPGPDWPAQLQAAAGDEAALLRIAQTAPVLQVKMAAVEALISEGALKSAEREFRSHDRKVHRLAKQRLEAAITTRLARAKAQTLLERTTVLLGQALVPVNHVVELDRDWLALPANALEPGQSVEFAERRARLDSVMRERDAAHLRLQRWTADAKRFLLDWQRAIHATAEQGSANDATLLGQAVQALRQARPEVAATAELDRSLAQAQQSACLVEARLAWLEAQPADAADPMPPAASADAQTVDAELTGLLNRRCEQTVRAFELTRQDPIALPPAVDKPPRPARVDAASSALRHQLETLLQQAEGALGDGQLAAMQQHLQALDGALDQAGPVALPDSLRARLQALRVERSRLVDWQQWGGARARDDLAAEAQALAGQTLARQTLAAADPAAPNAPKLNLKSHGDTIHSLRLRWKELDRHGAVASQEQWQRFDAALQTAHQPVAAQHAVLKAARQENLVAREALLAAFEARPAAESSAQAAQEAPDWRERVRELDRFQQAWRKFGPIEHTVPAESRPALQQRLRAAIDRIEAPLQQARVAAVAEREQLISRAESLLREGGTDRRFPDASRQVRDLQAAWQDQSRQLPLPRALENTLWTRFRAATDAVFAQRDAVFAARDAEGAAQLAQREALLERLSALHAEMPATEIERALTEVDRAWRQDSDLPRAASEALEARFRSAREAASALVAAGARRRWQAQCDTLAARLTWCEEREDSGAEAAELSPRPVSQDPLPAAWQRALDLRWARPIEPGPLTGAEVDDVLLRLEAALDLPLAPESQAARQQLKLRALKEAMEGRAPPKQGPTQPAAWLLSVVGQSGLAAAQRARLHALVTALRQAPPGALGSPINAG